MTTTAQRFMNKYDWWIIILFLIIAFFFITSCTTYQKCYDKYGKNINDTTFTIAYDTIAVTVSAITPYDNVEGALQTGVMVDYDSLVFIGFNGKARATFWKDRFDSLRFRAECIPDTIVLDTVIFRDIKVPVSIAQFEHPVAEKVKKNSLIERIAIWIGTAVMIIILVAALFFGAGKVVQKFIPGWGIFNWINKNS